MRLVAGLFVSALVLALPGGHAVGATTGSTQQSGGLSTASVITSTPVGYDPRWIPVRL